VSRRVARGGSRRHAHRARGVALTPVAGYRDLLRTRGVARIIAAQLTARFPGGMMSLAVLLHIEHLTHSYGAAGTVLAATSIGQAVAGPLTSRWMGAWGMRPVLLLTTGVQAAALLLLALVPLPVAVLVACGLVIGLSTPPVQPAVRTIYPKMVNASRLTRLFSLDASLQEIIWVVAPVLTTFVAIQISTVAALLLIIVFLLAGGAWFIFSPEVGQVRIPRSRHPLGRVLRKPPVILSTVVGLVMLAAISSLETGVVAAFGEGGLESGLILAVFAAGSLAGGLGFGHLPMGPWSAARRLAIMAFGIALTLISLNAWWLGVSVLVAGMGIAPVFALTFSIVSASVKFSETAEAYGWLNTGQLIGAALGSAIAGFVIDGVGPAAAFWVATGFAVLCVLLAAACVRGFPDLRGRDASPQPDTGMIQTVTGSFRMP